MRFDPVSYPDRPPVDAYGAGFFRVAGEVRPGPLLLLPTGLGAWGGLGDPAPLLAARVDVLLLGTGAAMAPPPKTLREALEAAGIPVEPMSTPSACRTYNVLLGEGRRVGLAALPV